MHLRLLHSLRILLLSLCALCLFPFIFPAIAHAASDPIQVTAQTESISFPNFIDFRMSAVDSSSTIVQVTLNVTGEDTTGIASATSSPVNFKAGRTISVDYHDDISGTSFITPGTPMQYSWVLKDSAGNTHTQALQHFILVDSRFSWQHETSGLVTVNWYNRPADFGQILLTGATGDISRIGGVLGGGLLHPINLWVYETPQDFHGALAPNSYEWVGGIAYPMLNQAFISVSGPSDTTLIRDMPHELTHLVFHQLTANGIAVPVWFDEGLAVYNQQYHESDMSSRFNEALASHSLLRLSKISFSFPADADLAYLAYAQSWNLVSYMYTTFGQVKMARFVKLMSNPSGDFSDDMAQALGVDTYHLENQWRLSLHQSSVLSPANTPTATTQPLTIPSKSLPSLTDGTEPVFVSLGVLLIVVPFFGIVFILINERRKRQKALVAQDAQRIVHMALDQPGTSAERGQPGVRQSPWADRTGPAYFPPFPPSPPVLPADERDIHHPPYPPFNPYREYPRQGPQKQAPQE
jgi:Peptidase MA superfamily